MTCAERIRMILLLQKMDEQPEYGKKLGLKNTSRFQGNMVENENMDD
ncbi:MAG: hypothetical protein PHN80_10160 [Hespellia sp.]|nr:hypothetical protein [Hespellia sp.]